MWKICYQKGVANVQNVYWLHFGCRWPRGSDFFYVFVIAMYFQHVFFWMQVILPCWWPHPLRPPPPRLPVTPPPRPLSNNPRRRDFLWRLLLLPLAATVTVTWWLPLPMLAWPTCHRGSVFRASDNSLICTDYIIQCRWVEDDDQLKQFGGNKTTK